MFHSYLGAEVLYIYLCVCAPFLELREEINSQQMDTMADRRISVLMLPWLAHGHISPFLELAKKLTKRYFHIYFCSTPASLNSIRGKISQKYSLSIELVELHLPSLPELPSHYHTTNGLPPHLMSTLKEALNMAAPSFSKILTNLKPNLLIYDFLQPWAPALASSQNIPAVEFWTSSATVASLAMHVGRVPGAKFPFPAIYIRDHEMPNFEKTIIESSRIVEECFERSTNIVLIKTFREIEENYIDYLEGITGKRIVPVGPLVQDSIGAEEKHEIIQWLDKKERSSTLFVSFGTEYFLSKEDMEELAHGLELSNVNFIWVVRFPVGGEISVKEALPSGFSTRVGEKGLVVEGWAPQAGILRHSSIGGFVSHCGWGSVIESIKYGVPIIAMPMHIDQPFNARLLEEVGVGVEVKRENDGRLHRDEVARVIKQVVVERSGQSVRNKAKDMSEELRDKGDAEIDKVVEELLQLCMKPN